MSKWNVGTGEYHSDKCIHVGSCRLFLRSPNEEINYMSVDVAPGLLITPEKSDVWILYHSLWTIFEKPLDPVTEYDSQRLVERIGSRFGSKFDRICRVAGNKIWFCSGPLSMHIDEKRVLEIFQDMKAVIGQLPNFIKEKFLVTQEISSQKAERTQ